MYERNIPLMFDVYEVTISLLLESVKFNKTKTNRRVLIVVDSPLTK